MVTHCYDGSMRPRLLLVALLLTLPAFAEQQRVGESGMTLIPPAGWSVVPPLEMPTPVPFMRVVVIRNGNSSVQVTRSPIPVEMANESMAKLAQLTGMNAIHTMSVAGFPAVEGTLSAGEATVNQVIVKHGLDLYMITAVASRDVLDEVLQSIAFDEKPPRVDAGGVSMMLPSGWRRLAASELANLDPATIMTIKHDVAGHAFAAVIPLLKQPVPKKIKGGSAVEIGRVIAAVSARHFHAAPVDVHETILDGVPAAEWRLTYKREEPTETLFSHMILFVRGKEFLTLGYVAPDDDEADKKTFAEVVKSVRIAK